VDAGDDGSDLSRSAYVSLDAGVAYPWRLENMVFFAANIYFRPINKAALRTFATPPTTTKPATRSCSAPAFG